MSAPMTAQPGAASGEAGTDITVARPVEHFPEQAYGCPLCADSGEYEPGRLCNCTAGSALYFLLTETEDKHYDR